MNNIAVVIVLKLRGNINRPPQKAQEGVNCDILAKESKVRIYVCIVCLEDPRHWKVNINLRKRMWKYTH